MCLVCIINAEEQREQNVSVSQTIAAVSTNGSFESDIYCAETETKTNYSPPPQSAVYYFAIGSMTNHIALQLRDLKPISSQPAILNGEFKTLSSSTQYTHSLTHSICRLSFTVQRKWWYGFSRRSR